MLKNVLIGKITGFDETTHMPKFTALKKLYAAGITNTSVTFEKVASSKEVEADDETEKAEAITSVKVTMSALGIDPDMKAMIEGLKVDNKGIILGKETGGEPDRFVILFEYANQKGINFQTWVLYASFEKAHTDTHNQRSSQGDISYVANGNAVPQTGGLFYLEVPSTSTAYWDDTTAIPSAVPTLGTVAA